MQPIVQTERATQMHINDVNVDVEKATYHFITDVSRCMIFSIRQITDKFLTFLAVESNHWG